MVNTDRFNKSMLLLIGCFSVTQIRVIGFIGISELFLYLVAPIFAVQDWKRLKRHGFQPILILSLLMLLGAHVANVYNDIPFGFAARGVAAPYAVFAIIVCLHHYLAPNISNMKWLLLGCAISGVISVFVFQYGASRVFQGEILQGREATLNVINYPLFWYSQCANWLTLPLKTMYLSTPLFYVIAVGVFLPGFALLQAGGRSAFLINAYGFALLVIGGKRRTSMLRIHRHIWVLMIGGVLLAFALTGIYRYAVKHEMMDEGHLRKYERQTRAGTGIIAMLVGGRVESFVGLYAALQNPWIGYGAWAQDTEGYYVDFLSRYGTEEDYRTLAGRLEAGEIGTIPGHSQMIMAWVWYGVFGLVFWLYVLYLYIATFVKYMAVIPQWYGYLALSLPAAFWNLFFSPFGNRIYVCLLFVVCLFVRAVAERRMPLPPELGDKSVGSGSFSPQKREAF